MQVEHCPRLRSYNLVCPASFAYHVRVQILFLIFINHFVQPLKMDSGVIQVFIRRRRSNSVSLRGDPCWLSHFLQTRQNGCMTDAKLLSEFWCCQVCTSFDTNAHLSMREGRPFLVWYWRSNWPCWKFVNQSYVVRQPIVYSPNAWWIERCD